MHARLKALVGDDNVGKVETTSYPLEYGEECDVTAFKAKDACKTSDRGRVGECVARAVHAARGVTLEREPGSPAKQLSWSVTADDR